MAIKEIKLNLFEGIAENKRDLGGGKYHYLENLSVGDFDNSLKQVVNVTTTSQDQCILRVLSYGGEIYGLGFDNSSNKDVTIYKYTSGAFVAMLNGTVTGTLRLYNPLFAVMDGIIYFDGGNGYVSKYTIASNTMSATPSGYSISGGISGGVAWQGNLYAWGETDNNIYKITSSALTSMIAIPTSQTPKQIIAYANYLAIICTASSVSNDGLSKMYLWDGITTTTFADIVDIGFGEVSGGDLLDSSIIVGISFPNRKGFRLKAYSGGGFQSVYTYYGKNNLVSPYLYCRLASPFKSHTGYVYFMVVGARPGSTYANIYEMTMFRFGRRDAGENYKLSVYKTMEVIPSAGNTLGNLGNDFVLSEDVSSLNATDIIIYAVVYEASFKTRQVVSTSAIYSGQPGVLETSIYAFGDSSVNKKLLGIVVQNFPLPALASVTLKYMADADTDWTTIFVNNTANSTDYVGKNIESTGANLPNFNEIKFRVEVLGGAELVGIQFKAEEMFDIYG